MAKFRSSPRPVTSPGTPRGLTDRKWIRKLITILFPKLSNCLHSSNISLLGTYATEISISQFSFFFHRKEISLIRIRGFIVSGTYALFFTSSAIAGFISVMALLLTENSLTPFKVFTLISTLANIKMAVTIFIADSLRCIEDARTTCNRMQHMLEKKFILTHKMDHQQKPSSLQVFLKVRKYIPNVIRTESFRNGKPA